MKIVTLQSDASGASPEQIMKLSDDEIIKIALSSPNILWKILKSPHKILGPWQENKGQGWAKPGSIARFTPKKSRLGAYIEVSKSQVLRPPSDVDFYEWGGIDEEGLEQAREAYKLDCLEWKEWSWRYSLNNNERLEYASSEAEAIANAEAYAISKGYLLYNGDK